MDWYAPNVEGRTGALVPGSFNYLVRVYIDAISRGRLQMTAELKNILDSIERQGINSTVEIMVVSLPALLNVTQLSLRGDLRLIYLCFTDPKIRRLTKY